MTSLKPSRRFIALGLLVGTAVGLAGATQAQRLDPAAGAWRTWVLASGSQFRLPPPDAAATREEAGQLRAMAAAPDAETRDRIAWWNAVAPSYRWNQVAMDEAIRAGLNANMASHHLALLHTALADAMIAAWDSKYAHNRPRPAEVDPALQPALPVPPTPSYPDEHAVAGTVAAAVLSYLFPQRAAAFAGLAEEEARLRPLARLAFPSDVAAGTALGRQVAEAALERARHDRSDQPWTGRVPTEPGHWNGTNPVLPQAAGWLPWLLASGSEFRPDPPPAADSPERAAEMATLRAFQRTPRTNADALFWEVAVGGLRNFQFWNAHLGRLLLEYGQGADAPRVARAYALFQAAFYDAGVACWDAKYTYWTIRPFQYDPEFRTAFQTPNHPSYPAAHACYSTTSALVIGRLFPREAETLLALALDAGESRIWAGIHYPGDVVAGRQLAEKVAGRAIERARSDGAGP